LFVALLFLACVCFGSYSDYKRTVDYTGHKVYKCKSTSRMQVDWFYEMVHSFGADVWGHLADGEMHFRVTPQQTLIDAVAIRLKHCEIMIEDVELYVQESEKLWQKESEKADEWFEEYHTYTDIVAWYQALAVQYPNLASFVPSIGNSFQGRAQPAIHFTSPVGSNKPTFYVQCQIHAREWISGAVCQYVVNQLLANYGNVQNVTEILDAANFVFVPFVNPDGYDYTWTGDRLWRKSRQTNSGSTCLGVDLNRNYNTHWGEGGSSSNPCSDTYMGASPNSSPEVKNTIAHFQSVAPVIGAIDMHSYSQLILRPWGYTTANSPDETFLKSVGDGMRDTILSAGGVTYTSQKSIQLYVTTGTASDWFYDTEATNGNEGYRAAGFTIELRDTGRFGFQLPPSEILPTGNEIYHTFLYFTERLLADPISTK